MAQALIVSDPKIMMGKPTLFRSRITVELILDKQRIDLQGLLAHVPFQLGDPALRPARFAVTGKDVTNSLAELPPPPLQDVGSYLQRAGSFRDRYPLFQPPDGGQFELFGELPSRQSHDSILHLMVSMKFES